MARIPMGNFGDAPVSIARAPQQNLSGVQAIGGAMQDVGNTLARTATGIQAQRREEADQINRIKAANALLDHELAVKQTGLDIQNEVGSGNLGYQQAETEFSKRISKLAPPVIDGADPVLMENVALGMRRQQAEAGFGMQAFAATKQREDYQSQFATGLDKLGKLAAMPGADVTAINERARAFAPLAKQAGLDAADVENALSTFSENNWLNRANVEIIDAGEDIASLKAVKQQLTTADGFYLDKLDPPRRLALAKSIDNEIQQIEYRRQMQADRLDAQALRTLTEVDRQISTGVPATGAMWDGWAKQVQGSQHEAEFKTRVAAEEQVQEVLRQPINDQIRYMQTAQAELQSAGGDLQKIANVQRMTTAVQANVKRLAEDPLQFYELRTGETVAPIDAQALMQGGDQLSTQMQERAAIIDGLRKQNGDLVQLRPLLPQEAKQLATVIDNATPAEQAQLFGTLRDAIGDRRIFMGAMQQIAPDSPVRAAAGMLMSLGGEQITQSSWLRPDQTVTAERAATTMLLGESILNKSKSAAAGDGKATTMPVPPQNTFATEFQARVGDTFAGRPQAFQTALQAVRAHYVGTSAETGDFATEVDTSRLDQSIRAAIGEVTTYHDNQLLMPWGMDESTFRDRIRVNLSGVLQARGMTAQQVNAVSTSFDRLDLINYGDGEYLLLDSARRPYLVNGEPVTVRATAP